jgi:ABC-2 type transport system ATP-binding protein
MIAAAQLTRRFGRLDALRGVDLSVGQGAIVGLLGPNGAGKTTLMRILSGQLRPSSGRATVAGHDVVRDRDALRREIGFLFETQNLYSRLTVFENLRLFAAIFDVPMAAISALLQQFGLYDRRSARVSTLSHGMRQKVLLARAFLHRPRVLFLDEPTTGLDPNWTKIVHELVLDIRQSGTTVLLATHQMQTADALCDSVAVIDQGRIVEHDAPHLLKRRYGTRRLDVEVMADGHAYHRSFSLDDPDSAEQLSALMREGAVLSVRTEEATLDDVFRQLTGTSLAREE